MRTEAEPTTTPTADPGRARLLRAIRYGALVYLGVRIGLSLLALLATALLPENPDAPLEILGDGRVLWDAAPIAPGWHNLVTAWERFDALWFLTIAEHGYIDGNGSAAFFPLYPLAIRAVSFAIGGHPLAAALLVSNLAYVGALVALYVITAQEWDEGVARRTTLYLAIFPTAFFLLAPYSEPLFLLLVLLGFLAARHGRWWLAGLAGAAAALTRNLGAVMALAYLFEGAHQAWDRWLVDDPRGARARLVWWLRGMWRPSAAGALVLAGTGAYLLFWQLFAGEPLAPLGQQATWQREFELPWITLWSGTQEAFRWIGQYPGAYHLLDWLLVVPAIVAAVWLAFRAGPTYAVYVGVSLLVPLSFIFAPRPFMSLPRFLLAMFPLFWAPAVWAARRPAVHTVVVAASSALLGVMTVLFVLWYFVF